VSLLLPYFPDDTRIVIHDPNELKDNVLEELHRFRVKALLRLTRPVRLRYLATLWLGTCRHHAQFHPRHLHTVVVPFPPPPDD
jgi:hypothetical protein